MKIVRFVAALLLLAVGLGTAATSAAAYPAGQLARAQINSTVFAPGGTVTVTVQNTTPGPLTMTIESAPVTIGTGTVGPDAQGSVSGTIPAGYSGSHTIVVYGAGNEVFTFAIIVTTNPTGENGTFQYTCTADDFGSVTFSGVNFRGSTTYTLVVDGRTFATGESTSAGLLDLTGSGPLGPGNVTAEVRGGGTGYGTFFPDVRCVGIPSPPVTSPPVTSPPATPPGTTSAPATAVGTSGAGRNGGNLASTGAQVGLGAGVGAAALLGGGVLLLVSRRCRSTPRHGG